MRNKGFFWVLIVFFLIFGAFFCFFIFQNKVIKEKIGAAPGPILLTTQADWQAGTLENADIISSPGSIKINDKSESELNLYNIFDSDPSSVTANANEATRGNAIDDNIGNSWNTGYSEAPVVYWWKIDLQNNYGLKKFRLLQETTATFMVRTSVDDVNYSDPISCMGFYEPDYCEKSINANAKFVKIEYQTGPAYPNASLYDFELFQNAIAHHTTADTQIDGTASLSSWDSFQPTQSTPAGTTIEYQFRSSNDGSSWTSWSAAQEYGGTAIDLSDIDARRYLQVKSILSTTDPAQTPTIDSYTINYTVSEPDPCADFDHTSISPSSKTLSPGESYTFTAISYDTGGGTIDDSFNWSVSCGSITGSGKYTAPASEGKTCTVSVTSNCGGSDSATVTVVEEPPPPPPDPCQDFDHIKITPAGGTYELGKEVDITAQAIDDNGEAMSGSIDLTGSSSQPFDLSGNTLILPDVYDSRVAVTASHSCGTGTVNFYTLPADSCLDYSHNKIMPAKAKVRTDQKLDFDAVGYKKDGSAYLSHELSFQFSAQKGSISDSGLYTPPNQSGIKDIITVSDSCGGSSQAIVEIVPTPDYCQGTSLDLKSPQGFWNNEHTSYGVYIPLTEDRPTHLDIEPRTITADGRDISSQMNYQFEALSPDAAHFINQVFYFGIERGVAKAQVTDSCYNNLTIDFILEGEDCVEPPCHPECGLKVIKPTKKSIWWLGEQSKMEWTSFCLDKFIDNILINLYPKEDYPYSVVDHYQNIGNYDWAVPEDNSLTSNQAVIEIIGRDRDDNEIAKDRSDRFRIKQRWLPLPELTPEIKTQLAAEGPLVSLLFLGLLWPYLIGTLDRNRFFTDLLSLLNFWIQEAKFFFYLKRRPKKWGVVYDYQDKLPLAYVKVMLFEKKSDRLKDTYITNSQGEFGFLVEPGDYYINIQKTGFTWALRAKEAPKINQFLNKDGSFKLGKKKDLWKEGVTDGYYNDLYFGQVFKEQGPRTKRRLQLSIPLIMVEQTLFNLLLSLFRKITNFFYRFRMPILIAGTIVAIYLLIAQRGLIDIIVLIIYIILWLIELLKVKELRGYGRVINTKGEGVGLAMIRVIAQDGRLIQTQVTGPDGRFILSCQPQFLTLRVRKPGYQFKEVKIKLKKLDDISKLDIRLVKA